MGDPIFNEDDYKAARRKYNIKHAVGVTKAAEERAKMTGMLSRIVDPAINPVRVATIRLDPYRGKWIVTVGPTMDVEVSCDTTGSMGGEVDIELATLPELVTAIREVLPDYDIHLCLGIFGDCVDKFVLCRPQFEITADKIVNYLREMAPQKGGGANNGEDPQYALFARAYLTNAYSNRIGLKGYHFTVTDEPCHATIERKQLLRIFGEHIFENELSSMRSNIPSMTQVIADLKAKTHQFVLLRQEHEGSATYRNWADLCGDASVIPIDTTRCLPQVISAIIGLTEGTLDIADLSEHLGEYDSPYLIRHLSRIDIGAQARLRRLLPHPLPKKGDIFENKSDNWPSQVADSTGTMPVVDMENRITYL